MKKSILDVQGSSPSCSALNVAVVGGGYGACGWPLDNQARVEEPGRFFKRSSEEEIIVFVVLIW